MALGDTGEAEAIVYDYFRSTTLASDTIKIGR